MASRIYCSCGKVLALHVTRRGLSLKCPDHGIQLRYVVTPPEPAEPEFVSAQSDPAVQKRLADRRR